MINNNKRWFRLIGEQIDMNDNVCRKEVSIFTPPNSHTRIGIIGVRQIRLAARAGYFTTEFKF